MAEERRGVVFAGGQRVASGPVLLSAALAEQLHPKGCLCAVCCSCGSEICGQSDLHLAGNEGLMELHARRYRERCVERAKELDDGGNRDDLEHALARAGVPADPISSARRFIPNPLTEAGVKFMQAPRDLARMLVLSGAPGVGKSTGAAIVMGAWIKRDGFQGPPPGSKVRRAVWMDANRLGVADPEQLYELKHYPFLVIDDLGLEGNEFGKANALALILDRHNDVRPTVVTTSLKRDQMRTYYQSDAMMDRLRANAIWPDLSKLKSLRRGRA